MSGPVPAANSSEALEQRAEQSAGAGEWTRAAREYLDAAAAARRESGGKGLEAREFELRLRAVEAQLRGVDFAAAWRIQAALLTDADIQLPSSETRARLAATWRRARFLLRQELAGEDSRGPHDIAQSQRQALLWSAARLWAPVDPNLADVLRTRHLQAVMARGNDSERCRALACEVAMQARVGLPFERSVKKLLARCDELAAFSGEASDAAWRDLAVATREFAGGRLRSCVEACSSAIAGFARLGELGEAEGARATALRGFARAWLGELDELATELEGQLREATQRRDTLAELEALAGQGMIAWLARGEGPQQLRRAKALLGEPPAHAAGTWPGRGYRRPHYRQLVAAVHVALYAGDPATAWAELLAHWRGLEAAFYPAMRTIGLELHWARARAALALAEQFDRDASLTRARLHAASEAAGAWDRAQLLADVRERLEGLRRDPSCLAPAIACLIEAGLRNLEGGARPAGQAEVRRLLDQAVRSFSAVDMQLHRSCARLALGELLGGVEGSQLEAQAEAWLAARGVAQPRRLAASQAPGFALA